MNLKTVFFLFTILLGINCQNDLESLKLGWTVLYPCEKTNKISYYSEAIDTNDDDFSFFISIAENLEKGSKINITFSVPVALNKSYKSMEFYFSRLDNLNIYMLKKEEKLLIRLKSVDGKVPEIESLLINNVERCKMNPSTTLRTPINHIDLFDNDEIIKKRDPPPKPAILSRPINPNCGNRKLHEKELPLITNGVDTKLGEWPWHAAMYRLQGSSIKYICGGTLISKSVVMSAAHCVTTNGIKLNPKVFSVVLGKYNLFGGDEKPQDRKVFDIAVHEHFNYSNLDNDITLLTLTTEAIYNDYVQPACLWTQDLLDDFPADDTVGTVVGWGLDHTDTIANVLQEASFPRIDQLQCIKSNPLFFSSALNEQSFCAGWRNGTSACKGDSGGGFHVFIPSTPGDTSPTAAGTWYVQGIVSQSATSRENGGCDPTNYVIFTDVAKMAVWIHDHL